MLKARFPTDFSFDLQLRHSELSRDCDCEQAFQEIVYSCLAKNDWERPTAEQLLQMRFFEVSPQGQI